MRELRAEQIQWVDFPPRRSRLWVPILSPKPGQPVRGLCLDDHPIGVNTHFVDGRTCPCTLGGGSCEHCSNGYGIRWKGYISGLAYGKPSFVLLEVTAETVRRKPEIFGPEYSLRSKELTLTRAGKSRCSTVIATISEIPLLKDLPQPLDVRGTLLKIWMGDSHSRLEAIFKERLK